MVRGVVFALLLTAQAVGAANWGKSADPGKPVHLDCLAGQKAGGGAGYANIVTSGDDTVTTADTVSTFKTKLAAMSSGETLFVESDVVLDLSAETGITIPAGATLAGDRGNSGSLGALLHYDTADSNQTGVFVAGGDDIRVTGLQLRGPHCDVGVVEDKWSRAVYIEYLNAEVDNNEVSCWGHAPVDMDARTRAVSVNYHDNYVHHNRRAGLGYGIVMAVSDGTPNDIDATIANNLFKENRHDIAASGYSGTSYTARYNVVSGSFITSHSFDCHGCNDRDDCPGPACDTLIIENNALLIGNFAGVRVRGQPEVASFVQDNCFIHPKQGDGTTQSNPRTGVEQTQVTPWDNMTVRRNHFNYAPHRAPSNWQ